MNFFKAYRAYQKEVSYWRNFFKGVRRELDEGGIVEKKGKLSFLVPYLYRICQLQGNNVVDFHSGVIEWNHIFTWIRDKLNEDRMVIVAFHKSNQYCIVKVGQYCILTGCDTQIKQNSFSDILDRMYWEDKDNNKVRMFDLEIPIPIVL